MKYRHLIPLLAVLLCGGCVTTPTGEQAPDPAILELTAQSAASVGAIAVLQYNPAYRLELELTRTSLITLVATASNDPAALQDALSHLPVSQLQGTNGTVLVAGAVTLIDAAGKQIAKIDSKHINQNWVLPISRGILSGLDQALGPRPK